MSRTLLSARDTMVDKADTFIVIMEHAFYWEGSDCNRKKYQLAINAVMKIEE